MTAQVAGHRDGQPDDISDPDSPRYDPGSADYDPTADRTSRYHLPERSTPVASGQQLRARVAQRLGGDPGISGWLGGFLDRALGEVAERQRYLHQLRQSARELAAGLATRPQPPVPHTPYQHMSHPAMDAMIRSNADPVALSESAAGWLATGDGMAGHQESLAGAVHATTADWRGPAADAAREFLDTVGRWFGDVGRGARLAGRQQEIHSQVLAETQRRMAANPPVAFDARAANAALQQISDPVQYMLQYQADMRAYHAQHAAQQQAARLMASYDEQVAGATTMPEFGRPPSL